MEMPFEVLNFLYERNSYEGSLTQINLSFINQTQNVQSVFVGSFTMLPAHILMQG
jgi:hypothetical protein